LRLIILGRYACCSIYTYDVGGRDGRKRWKEEVVERWERWMLWEAWERWKWGKRRDLSKRWDRGGDGLRRRGALVTV